MAKIITEIPDEDVDSHLNDFALQNHYQEMVGLESNLVPNPESKLDFAARKLAEFFSESVIAAQAQKQSDAARTKAIFDTKLLTGKITASAVPKQQ